MRGRSSRRRFLGDLGRGSAAAALLPAIGLPLGAAGTHEAAGTSQLAADPAGSSAAARRAPRHGEGLAALAGEPIDTVQDEAYWKLVRAQFPLRERVVPMNAANLCPAPRPVIDATNRAGADIDADVSFQNRAKYDGLREKVRTRLAAHLGVDADEIAIVRNTSEANNIIVSGVPLGPGDEVVVSDLNHPTCNVAWDVRAARHGFTVRRVSFAATPANAGEILDAFAAAFTSGVRLVAFTDVSNLTGIRMPTPELCALARQRGIHAHVDGAQSFGALRRDLRALGCDSYSASSHKWFMGPKEAGVLYVRRDRAADVWPGSVGVGWGDSAETALPGARRFETLGQRDDAVFAGLDAALDFHDTIGPARIEARVLALTTALLDAASSLPGVEPVTSADPALRAGVCILSVESVSARDLHERIYREHGIAGAPTGGMRLSPHIYNTMDDIGLAVDALRESLAALRG